jgi:outer membrane cobalamin receptor
MDDIFNENRYLLDDARVDNTYSPYEFYAGIKMKPIYNLLIDMYIDYKKINNQYFFVNKEYKCDTVRTEISKIFINRFNVLYSSASLTKIGIRANYNLRNLVNVEFKGSYNGWEVTSERYAWNKPAWEANLNTDFKINHDLTISANAFYESERWAKLGTMAIRMSPKVDINIGASYSYNNWLSVFGKINNLINNKYQDFYGYEVQGANGLVGVAFSF